MKENQEVWVPVTGFNGRYNISKRGTVNSIYNNQKQRQLKTRIDRAGYLTIRLDLNRHTRYIHRLIALAFIPNPSGLPIVNHINGDKLDNRIENLEWVTHTENVFHALPSHNNN